MHALIRTLFFFVLINIMYVYVYSSKQSNRKRRLNKLKDILGVPVVCCLHLTMDYKL